MSANKKSGLLERYEQMLRDNENYYFDADEWEEIAFQYEITDKYNEALEAVDKGLSIHPGNLELNIKKAKYFLSLDMVDDAEALIYSLPNESIDALLIRVELHLLKADPEDAIKLLDELIASEELTVDVCFEVIDIFLDFGYFDEMISFVYKASEALKEGVELLRELAMIYEDRQELDNAIKIYNNLLDKDPYSYIDWFNLAKVYVMRKDYAAAIDACDFALTAKDNDESVLSFKGYCLYDSGEYEKAIEVFKDFAEYVNDKSPAYELIAECYVKLENNAEAIKYLHQALQLNPADSNLCYQLSTNYYDLGDTPKALEYLQNAIALNPTDAEAYSFMGEIKLGLGEIEEAENYLQHSLSIDDADEETLKLLGDLNTQKEKYTEAIGFYEKALEINAFDIKLTFKLILAHYYAGNLDKVEVLIQQLNETTLQLDDLTDISESNKTELFQAKEMLDKLKDILRNGLNEELQ